MIEAYVFGYIDDETPQPVFEAIAKAERESKPLVVYVNSNGGHMFAGLAIARRMLASSARIITVIAGSAMSAAATIAACGNRGERYISPNGVLMVHDAQAYFAYGENPDHEASLAAFKASSAEMLALLDERRGKKRGTTAAEYAKGGRVDMFYSPADAVAASYVDHVGFPTIKNANEWKVEVSK